MARDEGEQQAMTSERLAEIARWVNDPDYYFASCDDDSEFMAIRDLLAEVERQRALTDIQREALHRANVLERAARLERDELRAREAALLAALRLNWMFLDCQECAAWRDVEQALPDVVAALRAAEQQQRSGGDGA